MRKVIVFFSAVFIIVASLILIGLIELTEIETNTLEIKLQNLPLWVEKESFVHISDIHFRHFSKREKQLLEKLKEINPDYIFITCLLYTSPSPRDKRQSRMPSSA